MKKIKLLCIAIIMIMLLTPLSMAAGDSFKLSLEPVSNEVTRGDTFDVKVFLDDIQVVSGEQGIAGYTAELTYDTNILSLEKVTANSGWEALENEGAVIVNTSNAEVVKQRTETIVLTFKVNDTASFGNTTIQIDSIEGTSIAETIDGTGSSTTIRIADKQDQGGDDNPTGNENQTGGNNQTGNGNQTGGNGQTGGNNQGNNTGNNVGVSGGSNSGNSNRINTVVNSVSGDNTQKNNGGLPYAGTVGYIGIAVVVLIIASIVFYHNYKKYRKV